jgi:hypothetical protein
VKSSAKVKEHRVVFIVRLAEDGRDGRESRRRNGRQFVWFSELDSLAPPAMLLSG